LNLLTKRNLARLIVYPLLLHFFGLVQLWHKNEHDHSLDRYIWGYELLAGKPIKSRVALVDSMFPLFAAPWSPKGSEVVGFCSPITLSDLKPEVRISRKYWESTSDAQQYLLLAHELGHCEFWLMHDNRMLSDGCPASLMNEYIPSAECAEAHFLDYAIEFAQKVRR